MLLKRGGGFAVENIRIGHVYVFFASIEFHLLKLPIDILKINTKIDKNLYMYTEDKYKNSVFLM